jgi:hypothetical protein
MAKVKNKVFPRTGHEGPEGEYSYNSTLSLTSALDGGGWLTPCPDRFTPRKEMRYPLCRRLSGLKMNEEEDTKKERKETFKNAQ